MTTPKPLSPAAQKVKDHFLANVLISPGHGIGAALRAAAPLMQFVQDHEKLCTIATELEGHHA